MRLQGFKILATGLNRHCNDFHIWTIIFCVHNYVLYMQHTGIYDYPPLAPIPPSSLKFAFRYSIIRLSVHSRQGIEITVDLFLNVLVTFQNPL